MHANQCQKTLFSLVSKAILSVGAALTLTGCVSSEPELITKIDPYTKETQFRLGGIYPNDCLGETNTPVVELSVIGGAEIQALSLNYTGSSWIFINSKLGLDLLIDGVPSKLKGVSGTSTDVGRYGVHESVYYFLDRATAVKMAQAKTIRFRASGSKGIVEKCLKESEIKSLNTVIPYLN